MARPTLFTSVKFRRLVYILKVPTPHAVGYLECLWAIAYECGQPIIGDTVDVELAAQWPGEPGQLCEALAAVGLLDAVDGGKWQIHDFWDHAPEYVKKRHERELGRKDRFRGRSNQTETPSNNVGKCPPFGGQRQTTAADVCRTAENGNTPAPAPTPTPTPLIPPYPPEGEQGGEEPGGEVLTTPEAKTALEGWERLNAERGKPLTPTRRRALMTKLAGMGHDRAVAALIHSTAAGYAGIVEPNYGREIATGPPVRTRARNEWRDKSIEEKALILLPDEPTEEGDDARGVPELGDEVRGQVRAEP